MNAKIKEICEILNANCYETNASILELYKSLAKSLALVGTDWRSYVIEVFGFNRVVTSFLSTVIELTDGTVIMTSKYGISVHKGDLRSVIEGHTALVLVREKTVTIVFYAPEDEASEED